MTGASADAVFAHMLLCMALSAKEIHAAVGEVRQVLRPGGIFVYTVRHTGDAHCPAVCGVSPRPCPNEQRVHTAPDTVVAAHRLGRVLSAWPAD
ncbi:methyltransferase domain-containing protein [Streptomyces sp. NPDC059002]|uniref:methyltransferase domain-containing protein n=1 Tax=Streptomyces sp. NPDC059002 TaxID=3346690 RepID=UPI0036823B0E